MRIFDIMDSNIKQSIKLTLFDAKANNLNKRWMSLR